MLWDLQFISSPHLQHRLQFETTWRQLGTLSHRACAFDVRKESGHSLKSSIRHILTVDRRDDAVFPTEGSLLRVTQEYAGLGGDIGFFKNHVDLQANLPLPVADTVIQACFAAGVLGKIDPDKRTTIADKFFLGGPLNLRGFEMRSVGAQSEGCYLGSNAYWTCGLHLFAPLPFRPGAGGFGDLFRTHLFVNAGNLGDWNLATANRATFDEALRGLRLSYGLGVAFKLGGIARVELNYCVPVRSDRSDRPAPGLQFGIGVNFV
jgi:outer membrane protein insertion porin family